MLNLKLSLSFLNILMLFTSRRFLMIPINKDNATVCLLAFNFQNEENC